MLTQAKQSKKVEIVTTLRTVEPALIESPIELELTKEQYEYLPIFFDARQKRNAAESFYKQVKNNLDLERFEGREQTVKLTYRGKVKAEIQVKARNMPKQDAYTQWINEIKATKA